MFRNCLISFLSGCAILHLIEGNDRVHKLGCVVSRSLWQKTFTRLSQVAKVKNLIDYDVNGISYEITEQQLFPVNVTEGNFQVKVKQYHLLLSFIYGVPLKSIALCAQHLLSWIVADANNEHFKILYKKIITKSHDRMKAVRNSLLHFSKWLHHEMRIETRTRLTNSIHKAVDNLLVLTEHINRQTDDCTADLLRRISTDIDDFYNKHVEPTLNVTLYTAATGFINKTVSESRTDHTKIRNTLNYLVNEFKKLTTLYNKLGFKFNKNHPDSIEIIQPGIYGPPAKDDEDVTYF